jgi:hypothetical protein
MAVDPYKLSDDLWLCENAVFLPKAKTLVASDLQLGYEQQLRALGHNVHYEQLQRMLTLLESLIAQTGATRLVIDGDLKHEFGRISAQERRDIIQLLSRLKDRVEIIVVKGNHDTITKPLTDELGVRLVDSFGTDGFYCIHGHKEPDPKDPMFKAAHTIIIGHEHPAVTLHDGVRKERYKCFLVGSYKRKRLVVLPSLSTIVEGTDILKDGDFSPILRADSSNVYVIADAIRPFGRVSALRRLLARLARG